MKLVIVESPTKAKTIQKFLGKENLLTHLKEHPEQVEEIYKDLLKISKGL